MNIPRASGAAPQASATRAQARRAARSLATVANWSGVAVSENDSWPSASARLRPSSTRARR